MPFYHLRSLPGFHWPPLPDAGVAQVWAAYQWLDRSQWLAPEEIERGQLVQARALLRHAADEVPHYRRALREAGVEPEAVQTMDDFRRLPVLSRRTLQEAPAAFLAERLPTGTTELPALRTSGSSGTPLTVAQTNTVRLWWFALYLRDVEWQGRDPLGRLATVRSTGPILDRAPQVLDGVTLPNLSRDLDPLIRSAATHLMDVRQDPRKQLAWLRGIAPDYLLSYPSNLEVLADLVRADGPVPGLKSIHTISDTLTAEGEGHIAAAFGVPVRDLYSCTEAGYVATTCPAGGGLHVHAENVILEVLDETGRPCAPGETGQVILTPLHNFRGPLIRYDVGDRATVGPARCACGRGLPTLARVHGKAVPAFHLPGGRRTSSAPLASAVRKVGGHWQHQIVQTAPDRVVVRLAITPDWTEAHADRLRAVVQAFFAGAVTVDVEEHDRLPTPASGKFQNVLVECGPT